MGEGECEKFQVVSGFRCHLVGEFLGAVELGIIPFLYKAVSFGCGKSFFAENQDF